MPDNPYDEKQRSPAPRSAARESADMRRDIDEHLRRVYQITLDEEVPERFRTLLAQLRERDG